MCRIKKGISFLVLHRYKDIFQIITHGRISNRTSHSGCVAKSNGYVESEKNILCNKTGHIKSITEVRNIDSRRHEYAMISPSRNETHIYSSYEQIRRNFALFFRLPCNVWDRKMCRLQQI